MQRYIALGFGLLLTLGANAALHAGELDGGGWSGKWLDTNKGHEGPLHARFQEDCAGNYRVVFTGKFAKVIPFRFKTTLNVVGHDGDKIVMAGESRIAFFYRFSYNAVADANSFTAQYHSKRWTGEFNLCR